MVMGPTCGMIRAQLGAEVIRSSRRGDKPAARGMGISFFPRSTAASAGVVSTHQAATRSMHAASPAQTCFWRISATACSTNRTRRDALKQRHPHLIVAGHKGFLSGPRASPGADEWWQMMWGSQ